MNNHNSSDSSPLSEGWDDCGRCLKPVSATRPPILNTDNCSCAERASLSNGLDLDAPYIANTAYHQATTTPLFQVAPLNYTVGHVPPSNTSSNLNDIAGQDGIERYAPDLETIPFGIHSPSPECLMPSNDFLPLNTGTTDNERFARRSFFFHSKLPYTMQSFLNAPDEPYANTFHSEDDPPLERHYTLPGGFLDQGMQFGNDSMIVAAQTSRRSKLSHNSSAEHSSLAERSWHVFRNVDGTLHVGGWMEHDGDMYENGNGYPLHMSGMIDREE